MPRPCHRSHPLSPSTCHLCKWCVSPTEKGRAYRRLWGELEPHGQSRGTGICRHQGEATGEFVECPSCMGKVRLKLLACAVHGRCTPTKSVPGIAFCPTCPDYNPPDPPRSLHLELSTTLGTPGGDFNPGITRWKDQLLICWRRGWAGGRLYLGRLAGSSYRLRDPIPLWIDHPHCVSGQEDPRLFIFRDRLHISFSGVYPGGNDILVDQMVARLNEECTAVEQVWTPVYSQRNPWEKNWSFFEYDGELYSVYCIQPHWVLHHVGQVAHNFANKTWAPNWSGGLMRGGAPPVRVGDEYYSFFHGRIDHGTVYTMGCYTFRARPPFEPLRYTPDPILWPDESLRYPGQHNSVCFPCGAVRTEKGWLISYGHHDRWCDLIEIENVTVEKALQPVKWVS